MSLSYLTQASVSFVASLKKKKKKIISHKSDKNKEKNFEKLQIAIHL